MEINTISEYVSAQSKPIQKRLIIILDLVRKLVPNAEESISYKMPAFRLNGKPLVYFAAYSKHIGFYPIPSGIETFAAEFKKYGFKFSKGSVQFPLDKELPINLIQKIVMFRKEQVAIAPKLVNR